MNTPKKHHFVPRAYLELFTDETGFLNLYDSQPDHWRRQKPKKAMYRTHYYRQTWAPDGVDVNILEKKLGADLEPNGLGALKKLVASPNNISKDDWDDITEYLAFQYVRTPKQAENAKALYKAAIESHIIANYGPEALEFTNVSIKDSFRFEFMQITNEIFKYLLAMDVEILTAPEDAEFITSDNPVVFANEKVLPPDDPGVARLGTRLFFSVDPKHLIVLTHKGYNQGNSDPLEIIEWKNDDYDDVVIDYDNHIDAATVARNNRTISRYSDRLLACNNKKTLDEVVGRVLDGC